MRSLLQSLTLLLALFCFAHGQADTAKLQGQIVCGTADWLKEDRRLVPYGDVLDREAAARCIEQGGPAQLAVLDAHGQTTFYALEGDAFGREQRGWLTYVGDAVEITGTVSTQDGSRRVKVDTLRVLVPAIADSGPQWDVVPGALDLTLKDLAGVRRQLGAYRGRVVILNFFATYCVPCRHELPLLTMIQDEYAVKGVQVIGISADEVWAVAKVRQFAKATKLNFPVWLGATEADMARFGLRATLPNTVIIAPDGRVVGRIEGPCNSAELRKQLDSLLHAEML